MPEMQEIFYQDPYCRTFSARVTACEEGSMGFEVELDDTAFYPEGGGQPSDTGFLNESRVLQVKRKGGKILHYVDRPLAVNTDVAGRIDWTRRLDNMQNHTAEHIFSGLVHQKFGFDNVGFHMDDDAITVDFNGEISETDLTAFEADVNEKIRQNIPTDIFFPDTEALSQLVYRSKKELSGKVRIVRVPGCDCCACCGTHVRASGEIGLFKILDAMRHRGGTRVRFVAGIRALRDYHRRLKASQKISVLLSAKPLEIDTAVEKTLQELSLTEQKLNERTRRWFECLCEKVACGTDPVIVCEDGLSAYELKRLASMLSERFPQAAIAALSESSSDVFNYVLALSDPSLTDKSKALNQRLNGRGGGRDGQVQGTYRASKENVLTALREVLGRV